MMLRACAVLMLVLVAGCASTDSLRSAQGSGEKKIYGVSYERAWNLIPYSISETGGKVKERNFEQGYVFAESGITWTSFGERVALFCQRKGTSQVEIEVVSKSGVGLSSDWTAKIFASLDRNLRP